MKYTWDLSSCVSHIKQKSGDQNLRLSLRFTEYIAVFKTCFS